MAATNFKLRSDLEKATYNEFVYTTTGDITAGTMAKINDTVGVYVSDTDSGDDNTFVYQASKILVPCVALPSGAGSGSSYTVGSKVYFDETNAEVTQTSSGNTLCGIVVEDGSSGDETLLIHLDGLLGITS